MLRVSLAFLFMTLLMALFGFTDCAGAASGISRVLFYFLFIAFVAALVGGLLSSDLRGKRLA